MRENLNKFKIREFSFGDRPAVVISDNFMTRFFISRASFSLFVSNVLPLTSTKCFFAESDPIYTGNKTDFTVTATAFYQVPALSRLDELLDGGWLRRWQ